MAWAFLHRWYMPFVWITFAWLIAVPMAIYFEHGMTMHHGAELGLPYGSAWVRRDDLLAALMPYFLGFGAAVWLINEDGSTRWAAFWATLIALARTVAPFSLAVLSDTSAPGAQHFVDWQTLRYVLWFQDFEMFALGILIWGAFARFVGSHRAEPAPHGSYAEA